MERAFQRPADWQEKFMASLKESIAAHGSKSEFARRLGVDYATVLSWLRGATPSEANLQRFESYLAQRAKQ